MHYFEIYVTPSLLTAPSHPEAQMTFFFFLERNKMKLSWLCLLVIQGDKQIKLPNIQDTPVRRCDCEMEGQRQKR